VKLPRPSQPNDSSQQINCPHQEEDLVDWHAIFSPSQGDSIVIPINTRVVIMQTVSVQLSLIDIPSTSELIIGENTAGIHLSVTGIFVKGKFTIGSETCRIASKITITLHGARPGDVVTNVPDPTLKGIAVSGGTLSFHGKRFFQTWTRLSATAKPGDSFLRLQEDVNWEAGSEIVLVTTAMKDSKEWHQNEVLKIQSVDNTPSVGSIVHLQTNVAYKHVGTSAYQAEVGLLTRAIVVQGSPLDSDPIDSEPRKCKGRWIFGNTDAPCPDKDLTGYGGHIIIYNGGRGFVEGVELFRMGQTNVLGRYPIHFHALNDCPECYFRDSSVHKSFYRCVSIHGTNNVTVSENVAFNVAGYCYYLEDGVEQHNKLHFNLAAHIHMIGPSIPTGDGQQTQIYQQSATLTLPADVTAAGFYITNVRNELIGNAASGGWAGFAFPNLPRPIGIYRNVNMRPSSVMPLPGNKLDGNTVHSSGWWWYHAGAFYFGGALYYNSQNVLEYNPGRSSNFNEHNRKTCAIDLCAQGDCNGWCPFEMQAFVRLSNSKAFLIPSVGLNSWSGRMEILGYESHDSALSIEALEPGFWVDDMLVNCRSGESLVLPPGATAIYIGAYGFGWYDTGQEHIITRSTFRNCGTLTNGGGCDPTSPTVGCHTKSSVFRFLTHSSQFNPEIMQVRYSIPHTVYRTICFLTHYSYSNSGNKSYFDRIMWSSISTV
jgi:G8 domain